MNTFVTDFSDFVGRDGRLVGGAAGRLATQLGFIVEAGTARPSGLWHRTGLRCRRRPQRTACTGRLLVRRTDVPAAVAWECPECGDGGVVSGWEESAWDLRLAVDELRHTPLREVAIAIEDFDALLAETELASDHPLVLGMARLQAGGRLVLVGSEAGLACLAAEIAHDLREGVIAARRRGPLARVRETLAAHLSPT